MNMTVERKNTETNIIPQFDESDFEIILDMEDDPQPDNSQETPVTKPAQQTTTDSDPQLAATFNLFKDKGWVQGEEVKTWEELDERVAELPKAITSSIIDSAPDLAKALLDFTFNSGKDITKESLKDFMQTYLEDLDLIEREVSITDNNQAREFLAKEYAKSGMRKSAIDAALDALEDDEDETALISEAKKLAEEQKKVTPKHVAKLDNVKQQNQNNEAQAKDFIKKVDTTLNETGWSKQRIETIKRTLVSGQANQTILEASAHPKALIQLANLTTFFNKEKGEFDFEAYIKQQTTKDVEKNKESIAKNYFSSIQTKSDSSERTQRNSLLDDLIPIN